MAGALAAVESGSAPAEAQCRVSERFPCDVPASCQPPSDWKRGGQKWLARVRNVSTGGLCLVLNRRFERGAGLAIELPGADPDAPSTLLARVMNVRADGAGAWILGCAFVSPLSDEELQSLTHLPEAEAAKAPFVADVHFRGKLSGGVVVERLIRKLNLNGSWPLAPNRRIGLRFHDGAGGETTVRVRVDACRSAAGRWVLECTFVEAPPSYLR